MSQPLQTSGFARYGVVALRVVALVQLERSSGQNSTQNPQPLQLSCLITTTPRKFFFFAAGCGSRHRLLLGELQPELAGLERGAMTTTRVVAETWIRIKSDRFRANFFGDFIDPTIDQ